MRAILYGAGAAILLLPLVLTAEASDDPPEPLFVYENGRRVPTRIIPPTQPRPDAQNAVRRVQAADADDAQQDPGEVDERSTERDRDQAFETDPRYADHAISFLRRPQRGSRAYYGFGLHRAVEDAYHAGRADERYYLRHRFNRRDMLQRRQRLMTAHERALRHGQDRLRQGDYPRAAIALALAAELNNGDPACRIHLAQSQLAQGHYEEAGRTLRRALELQPALMYAQLQLGTYYPGPEDFARHVDALAKRVSRNAVSADVYLLLGYMQYQRDDLAAAHAAFRRLAQARPDDALAQTGVKLTKPASD